MPMRFLLLITCLACIINIQGQQTTVTLDNYFNNEWKKDSTGKDVPYHYTWEDKENTGFSLFGDIFARYGVKRNTLTASPTRQNLKNTNIYIIVDPDTDKETLHPNYIRTTDIDAISKWVAGGGILLLMANDSANTEFEHFNHLASRFGIHFNEDRKNHVIGNNVADGAILVPARHFIFTTARKVYMKDISTISVKRPAAIVLKNGSDNVIALAKYGRGVVLAVGDPWFYNEYVTDKNLPADFENYAAANDLVKWLLKQIHR